MKIEFEGIEINISDKITVFTCDNGVGKTRVLTEVSNNLIKVNKKYMFFRDEYTVSEKKQIEYNLNLIYLKGDSILLELINYVKLFFPQITNIEFSSNMEYDFINNKYLLIIGKNNVSFEFSGLSSSERRIILLLMNILLYESEYIIIDDIELYLDLKQQRNIIKNLLELFPEKQFIISTNSPIILGEVKPENVRRLHIDIETNKLKSYTPNQSFGLDVNQVLSYVMGCYKVLRNSDVHNKLREIHTIVDNENFSEARIKISELEYILNGSIPEIVEINATISFLEDELED